MCIIMCKPSDIIMKDSMIKSIEKCWDNNRDGAGYMIKRAGKNEVFVNKGFFAKKSFISEIEGLDAQFGDELVVHLRLATHGCKSSSNCHPFKISEKHMDVGEIKFTTDKFPCIAHNGIVGGYGNKVDSDTYDFVRTILADYPSHREERREDLYEALFGFNKFAILSPRHEMLTIGGFEVSDGIMYSNGQYWRKESTFRGSESAYRGNGMAGLYGTGYNGYGDGAWD